MCQNGDLEHFLSDKIYSTYYGLFCFTETNLNGVPAKYIDEVLDDWRDIHKNTQRGLALCYYVSKVITIEVSEYSPHVYGAILDLAFDTSNFNTVSSLPSPCSDDFVLFFQRHVFF